MTSFLPPGPIKVIFLDIDGVLNYSGCHDEIDGMRGIERDKVALLNQIILETDALCVLSSTWRLIHSLEDMRTFLLDRGFIGLLIDKTPDGRGGQRGYEINAWLNRHKDKAGARPIQSFIILDDNSDMAMWKHRLVQTGDETGLSANDVLKAIDMLNGRGDS